MTIKPGDKLFRTCMDGPDHTDPAFNFFHGSVLTVTNVTTFNFEATLFDPYLLREKSIGIPIKYLDEVYFIKVAELNTT